MGRSGYNEELFIHAPGISRKTAMNKTMSKSAFGTAKKSGAGPRAGSAAPSAPIQAMQLLGRWTRVAQGHIAFGMGCSCCTEFGNVQVQDMEQHILDYLDTKYRAQGVEGVSRLLIDRAGYKPGASGSVAELLRAVATQSGVPLSAENQLSLLSDLNRSIDSLDEMLQGRG